MPEELETFLDAIYSINNGNGALVVYSPLGLTPLTLPVSLPIINILGLYPKLIGSHKLTSVSPLPIPKLLEVEVCVING